MRRAATLCFGATFEIGFEINQTVNHHGDPMMLPARMLNESLQLLREIFPEGAGLSL